MNRDLATVSTDKGKLRLRFRHPETKRVVYIYLGLTDSKPYRAFAEQKRQQLCIDILAENLDPSYNKYRFYSDERKDSRSLDSVLSEFIKRRSSSVTTKRSLILYKAVIAKLKVFLGDRATVGNVDQKKAEKFFNSLTQTHSHETVKAYRMALRAIWKDLDLGDLWVDVKLQKQPKKEPRSLTVEQVQQVLEYAKGTRYYNALYFMASSGVRVGEMLGLTWSDIDFKAKTIGINRSLTNYQIRPVKCNKPRVIFANDSLMDFLENIKPIVSKPSDYIFDCCYDALSNFWEKALKTLGFEHVKLYSLRSFFISQSLQKGMSLKDVSSIAGNSPKIILSNYLAQTTKPVLPQLFD